MSLFKRKRDPVQHFELSEKHKWPRLVLIAVLIIIAAAALTTALMSYLNGDPGWRTIEANSAEVNCSEEFIFNYYFPNTGNASRKASNQITSLYTEAAQKAYWLFNADGTKDALCNVYHINTHVNEVVTVEDVLYDALGLLDAQGGRYLYLAPIYAEYDNLFFSETDVEAEYHDPARNEEMADYFSQILKFANDPEMIRLELLGNNQLRLNVSDAYLAFAQENEIQSFIDFHWMKNAFIIDYFADVMAEAGFTDGYFASSDGFTRNLHAAGESYSFNIFDRVENSVYLAARMEYAKPLSIVYLRNYPMSQADRWYYYGYADGRIVTPYIDPADGMSRSAANNIVSYGESSGCAEILMGLLPVYIARELDVPALQAMAAEEVYSIWCVDTCIQYNDVDLSLYDLHEGDGLKYTQALVTK